MNPSIETPRIDRQFVAPSTGRLTDFGYAFLQKLWTRSGGAGGFDIAVLMDEADFSALAPAGHYVMADGLGTSPAAGQTNATDFTVDPRSYITEALVDALQGTVLGISQRFEF